MEINALQKIDITQIKIEKLNDTHNVQTFDTSDVDLSDFIKNDALRQSKIDLSITYVCIYHNKIIAYFTICADTLEIKNPNGFIKEVNDDFSDRDVYYDRFPALQIYRLCVIDEYQYKGCGKFIINAITDIAYEINKNLAIKFIVVDSKSSEIGFYKKCLFNEISFSDKNGQCLMFRCVN